MCDGIKHFGITIKRPTAHRRDYVFEFFRTEFTAPPDFGKAAEDQLRELADLMGFDVTPRSTSEVRTGGPR